MRPYTRQRSPAEVQIDVPVPDNSVAGIPGGRVTRRIGNNTALPVLANVGYSFPLEAFMPGPVHCVVCDKPETQCSCEKYCTICQGQTNVRLGADGLYYCPDCREACDVPLANSRGN